MIRPKFSEATCLYGYDIWRLLVASAGCVCSSHEFINTVIDFWRLVRGNEGGSWGGDGKGGCCPQNDQDA